MIEPLAGTVAVVTGASSGIGRAIALAAGGAGADVALTYRVNSAGAHEVVDRIRQMGRRAESFQLDLAEPVSVSRLASRVREEFGRIDAWFNNAGADVLTGAGAEMALLEKLDHLLAIDLRGTMLASWEVGRIMAMQPTGGVIINMSWDHVTTGMQGENPELFSAVKGGVSSFSRSLARSLAPTVRVNILAPGWIRTAFGATMDSEIYQQVAESTPLKRWGTPEDVAQAAVWLASPAAAFITGQTIAVNGGTVM